MEDKNSRLMGCHVTMKDGHVTMDTPLGYFFTHISHVILDSILSEVGWSVDSVEFSGSLDVCLLKVLLVDPQLVGDLRTQVHCENRVSPVTHTHTTHLPLTYHPTPNS